VKTAKSKPVRPILYLAERRVRGKSYYFIRESYKSRSCYKSRELFSLGTNPARYIVYPGGNAFYVEEIVEDKLSSLGATASPEEIEDVFWPFVKPEIRRVLESFRQKAQARRKRTRMTPEEEGQIQTQTSWFDKRRVHYLRSGRTDQRGIGRMPVQLYAWLVGKSRDEIEQRFMRMERRLKSWELKKYVFVIFDLQRFFTQSWAREIPQGLEQATLDKHFLQEICRLNRDPSFWAGEKTGEFIHEYLIRYVIMFFDTSFGPDSFLRDYVRDFMDSHRKWRFPKRRSTVTLAEASSIFGVEKDILDTMSKRSLVRLFRRMAQRLHPDKGGKHEAFIKLTEAYRELLRRKGRV
jgi:hypothetical protein